MKILGIETSCDETAVAVLEVRADKIEVLTNTISSQVKLHAKYGGVVPNLAAREHVKNIEHVFKLALKKAKIKDFEKEIDLIAVTRGPGLGPALLVGITFAKTLAWKYKKPLVGVNHLEGHVYSNWLKPVEIKSAIINSQFPILNLIVSGGHTELVLMNGYGKYELLGETVDDAIGEAFDKVARLLGLGYPGGPIISKLAESGNPDRYPLPSPMIKSKDFNFSYSGLKTAVLYLLRDLKLKKIDSQTKADIASSFQKSACEVLLRKTIKAAQTYKVKSIHLSGGVSANKYLRENLQRKTKELGLSYSQPEFEYTGDNAAMIALAGYFVTRRGASTSLAPFRPRSLRSQGSLLTPASPKRKKPQDLTWDSVEMDSNLGFSDNSA